MSIASLVPTTIPNVTIGGTLVPGSEGGASGITSQGAGANGLLTQSPGLSLSTFLGVFVDLLAVLAVGAGSRFWRRLRLSVTSLPRGNSVLQFHPPQFS